MNLILLHAEDFLNPTQVRLYGRRREHVLNIHRAAVGDDLRVGLINGLLGHGQIFRLTNQALELESYWISRHQNHSR